MKKVLSFLLVIILLVIANKTVIASDIRSDTNPLAGPTVEYIFIDASENIVARERLVNNQSIFIINRQGSILREFAARQTTMITVPNVPVEPGRVHVGWKTYFIGSAFYLEPVFRIKLNIVAEEGTLVTLVCDPGHVVRVLGFDDVVLMEETFTDPTTVRIPQAPAVEGYVFSYWETVNDEEVFEIHAIYELLPPQDPESESVVSLMYGQGQRLVINGFGIPLVAILGAASFLVVTSALFIVRKKRKKSKEQEALDKP